MICAFCSKNYAQIHVTEVVNGVRKETHLCEECARSSPDRFTFTFSLDKILEQLKPPGGASDPKTPRRD
jgi:protein arginine kinase activator